MLMAVVVVVVGDGRGVGGQWASGAPLTKGKGVLFNPERYQKNRVYKPVQLACRFSRDMPSVAASSCHVSSDNDSDSSGFAS
jgi:hypothetical protein